MDHHAVALAMSERDPQGRWLKGHKAPMLAGRLPRSVDQAYLDVLLGQCDLQKWGEICKVAVTDAIEGNIAARRYAREWLGRILIPAIERILIASFQVNVDTGDNKEAVARLVQTLLAAESVGDDSQVVDSTASTVDDKQQSPRG